MFYCFGLLVDDFLLTQSRKVAKIYFVYIDLTQE